MKGLANSCPFPKMKRIEVDNRVFIIQDNKLLIERKRLVEVNKTWKIEVYWELLCEDITKND